MDGRMASGGAIDQAPFLARRGSGDRRPGGAPGILEAFRFIRRASGRRSMREPSVMVRESAAVQLEERQSDWAYSKPVVSLDILWNLAIVGAAACVLFTSRREETPVPLRLWIAGYVLQCVVHVACVAVEYRQRHPRRAARGEDGGGGGHGRSGTNLSAGEAIGGSRFGSDELQDEEKTSFVKHVESANTMFSFIWWIIGFYWISDGGQDLTHDAVQLYGICIAFLVFDVFFVVFCVSLACVVGIAVCCCLPCIIAFLYAVADQQDGASVEEIGQLPKFEFHRIGEAEKPGEVSERLRGVMSECGSEVPNEHVLSAEDAECCICLTAYDDGAELRELPCRHHFHCACVDRWLFINATCPLCKFNIATSGGGGRGREEV